MIAPTTAQVRSLEQRLSEAEATVHALLHGEIDAFIDGASMTPVLLSQAQAALRESEERYRQIVETALEGILIVGLTGTLTFVNRRFAELLGYSVEEIVGRTMFSLIPASNQERARLRLEHSQQGFSEEHEVTFLRQDGTGLWAMLRTTPLHDADGHLIGTLGMMTDRTRTRVAEEALRKSEAQYRHIVETTSDGIVQCDEHDVVVFVNRRLGEMLGYTPAEMVGRSLFDFMNPEAQATVTVSLRKTEPGTRPTVDTTYRRKDGTDIPVNVAGSGVFDDEGRLVGNVGIVRDVTERKKLQAQLMVSDRMASIGTLAAGVAHEINNPLAAVMANLDYMADRLKPSRSGRGSPAQPDRSAAWLYGEIREPLRDAKEAAQRMRAIVRDLRVFSSTERDEQLGPLDVNALMESTLRIADNEIRHRARVVRDYGAVLGVRANEARLGQVFLNLLVNAAQALPEGQAEHHEIGVKTRLVGTQVITEVSDTGPGIPPHIIGRIFDAFFTTKHVGSGTGLGLTISHRIITDMGGEITVKSVMGKGTTFRVALDVAPVTAVEPASPVQAVEPTKLRGRVLVVDDELMLLRILTLVLKDDHDVVTTSTASEALALFTGGQTFDLILCDMMMPQMSGMDLHRELSLINPEQAQRMVFLTGGAFTQAAQAFLADGDKEYIEKPFDFTNVRSVIQRHLRANKR